MAPQYRTPHSTLARQWRELALGLSTIFSNISENIDGPAHFRIREYSREYRCPGAAFSQESMSFLQPLTLVDLESQDILEYSRRYIAASRTVLTRASRNSSFAPSKVGFGSMQTEIFKFWTFLSGLGAQTSTLERFLASADLSRGENILNIREYSREYRWSGENISKRI